jgi:hypothetical protein
MTEELNKWITAISKMIDLTQKNRLKWTPERPFPTLRTEKSDIIGPVYKTRYKNKYIRIYERQFIDRRVKERPPSGTFSMSELSSRIFSPTEWEEFVNTEINMDLIDRDDNKLSSFPKSLALKDLFSTVQYQASGVNEFLDDIINEPLE